LPVDFILFFWQGSAVAAFFSRLLPRRAIGVVEPSPVNDNKIKRNKITWYFDFLFSGALLPARSFFLKLFVGFHNIFCPL
jgi:hypothetical protein